jgi:hypothetical protein
MSPALRRRYRRVTLVLLLAGVSILFPGIGEPLPPDLQLPALVLVSVTVIAVRYLVTRYLKRVEDPDSR